MVSGEQAEERVCLRSVGTARPTLIEMATLLPARPCGPAPVLFCASLLTRSHLGHLQRLEVVSQFLFQKIARTVDARFDRPV